MTGELERDLREAVVHVEITRLLDAYADVINRRALAELDELFLPDCEVVIDARRGTPVNVQGGEGVARFVGEAIERFDFFEFVPLSLRTWIDGEDLATGRSYMCELRQARDSGRRSQAFGVYHDRFRRDGGRWRFAARRYHSLARTAATAHRDLDVFDFPATDR